MVKELLLYKYEPKYLDDFEENENITSILKSFIKIDIIRILFVSRQSNGKSSYIKAIINEYYKGNTQDILYINNLKDYGISFYKNDVQHFCKTPSPTTKKMIVLDDFDFMNEQCQQIFKNIMEKYTNIHFLLSCSNPQKIILGIQSLMHIIEIKKLQPEKMLNIFNKIKKEEEIIIGDIELNNVKQMINTMEKYMLLNIETNIECSLKPIFQSYLNELKNKNITKCIDIFYELYYNGYSVIDILYGFYDYIKDEDEHTRHEIIPSICKYINIFYSHEDVIELALFTHNLSKISFNINEHF